MYISRHLGLMNERHFMIFSPYPPTTLRGSMVDGESLWVVLQTGGGC